VADGVWSGNLIEADISADPNLRAALDTVQEKWNVFPQAQQMVPEAERQWSIKTLRDELAQYGNLEPFESHLTGSGAIAQHRSMAVGERAVAVGGPITDSTIVTGNLTQNVYAGGAVQLPSHLSPDMEIITPGRYFGRLKSQNGRLARLLKVKCRNASEQPALIDCFKIQYMGG
jgi:hypothetical protein